MSKTRSGPLNPTSPSAVIAHGLLLVGVTAGIALVGFASQGSLAAFLLCAGFAMLFCPPSASVGKRWWIGGGTLVACCAGALLPARLLPSWPLWRRTLQAIPLISLPTTISPAPQETLFWWVVLALTVVIGLFMLAQPVRSKAFVYLVLGATLMCGTHTVLSIFARLAGWKLPLVQGTPFGFFPNRNHTAIFLVTGSILSLSLLNTAALTRKWLMLDLALAALVPCVGALFFFSGSRAGIVFLIVGVAIWLAGFLGRHGSRRLLAAHGAVFLVAAGLFLAFPSIARDRLLSSVGVIAPALENPIPSPPPSTLIPEASHPGRVAEFRVSIWRDTLKMIADTPFTGTGLGTFTYVFPQYEQRSVNAFRVMHPESDWLMMIAEAGLPAFLCVAILAVGLVGRLVRGRNHRLWPLRWGCGAAAVTALLHGAVDVPAHRVVLGWWILVLAGLSLSLNQSGFDGRKLADSGAPPPRWSWQRIFFLAGGVGAILLGGFLAAAEWFGGPDLPPFAVGQAPYRIFDLQERKNFAAAEALTRRIIGMSPMFDQSYFQLGVSLASQSDEEGTDAKVDEVFRAQRVLDPVTPSVSVLQGNGWNGYDPVRQAAMCLDAVSRQGRVDRLLGYGSEKTLEYFGEMVGQLRSQPDVQRYLLEATRPDVRFGRAWLTGATTELAQELAGQIATDEEFLRGLAAADRHLLKPDWYLGKEKDQPQFLLPDGRGAAAEAWPVRLRQMVNAGRFEQAVAALSRRYDIFLDLPPKIAGFDVSPQPDSKLATIQTAWSNGDTATARRLLKETAVDLNDPANVELIRWQAALAVRDANWADAWYALERYVRHTRQTEWP